MSEYGEEAKRLLANAQNSRDPQEWNAYTLMSIAASLIEITQLLSDKESRSEQ